MNLFANDDPETKKITIAREDIKKLKKKIRETEPGGVFIHNGNHFLREYAVHMVEYLEMKFK